MAIFAIIAILLATLFTACTPPEEVGNDYSDGHGHVDSPWNTAETNAAYRK
ncbi:MAG: hypothetical protein SFH39_00130 [Candidatus Magnetobacterium sp. LHC-1]